MAIKFGLTDKGFIAPTYAEWLDSIHEDLRSMFGDDIALSSNSNFGLIAEMYAWRLTEITNQLELVYYSGFYSTANNTALDRLGSNIAVPRKVATNSHAIIVIETDGEYLIQAGEEFETEDGIIFELTEDVLTVQDKDGKWTGTGNVESQETGAFNNVIANTITIVSNPDDNIISVTNPDHAAGGQDEESDDNYRKRLIMENAAKEGPTRNGIRSALLNLPGVRNVGFVDNKTDQVDQYGNPPESVHVYVLGGTDNDIAQTLYDRSAAGTTLTGTKAIKIVDETGNSDVMRFDSASEKPIFVKVKIQTTNGWNTDDGSNNVKNSIVDSINALDMGQTVYLTKLYPIVYQIPGIQEAEIVLGTSKDNLGSADIATERFEVPVCSLANVEVVLNG